MKKKFSSSDSTRKKINKTRLSGNILGEEGSN